MDDRTAIANRIALHLEALVGLLGNKEVSDLHVPGQERFKETAEFLQAQFPFEPVTVDQKQILFEMDLEMVADLSPKELVRDFIGPQTEFDYRLAWDDYQQSLKDDEDNEV